MQVKKTFKGHKQIIQVGSKALGMENPKETQSPMKETKL